MKLIVGLGNPGEKYAKTRHNVGFMVVEELAQKFSSSNFHFSFDKKVSAEILKCKQKEEEIILAKPQTMMNASGIAVSKLLNFYHLPLSSLWVIHDDLDLPLGHLKIVKGRGSAGHHGVNSIIGSLSTAAFVRFRVGIGHPGKVESQEKAREVEDYVLEEFRGKEAVEAGKVIDKTVDMIKLALTKGLNQTMGRING